MKKSSSHVSFSTSNAMPYGQVARRRRARAPRRWNVVDERDRLPVQRGVLGRRRRAEVRLQRDVAEILEREHAEIVRRGRGCAAPAPASREQRARRSRTAASRSRTAPRGAPARTTAPSGGRTRKYRRSDASPVSGTTRGARRAETAPIEICVDALALIGGSATWLLMSLRLEGPTSGKRPHRSSPSRLHPRRRPSPARTIAQRS